jgi:hypothetical protein
MKTRTLLIGSSLVAAIGLVMAPGLGLAQDSTKQINKGGDDFAKARADADAKAKSFQDTHQKNRQDQDQKAKQDTDVDVKNKLSQQTTASGVGTVDVKNKSSNINYNQLKTGDTVNLNSNVNTQSQSFGIPFKGTRGN